MQRAILALVLCLVVWPVALVAQKARRGTITPVTSAPMKGAVISVHGTLKQLDKRTIVLESDDRRVLEIRRSKKTAFLRDADEIEPYDIDLESRVVVELVEDRDLKLRALAVKVDGRRPGRSSQER